MPAMIFAAAALAVLQQAAISEPVPRAIYLSQMDQQFQGMDGNGDGLVTPEEATARQDADNRAQVIAANRQIFSQLDQDGDGMLTATEFARLAAAPPAPDPGPLMKRLDLDSNGVVSLLEHRRVMLATFDATDTDLDGVVTPEEMAARNRVQAQAPQQAPQQAAAQGR